MQNDIADKLRSAQRHLVEAARAIDGASVHVRTMLELHERERRARATPKSETNGDAENDT